MTRLVTSLGIAALTLAGCSKGPSPPEPLSERSLAALPGVYAGVFPCTNCAGILTRLWLRPDGRFFMTETYEDRLEDVGDDRAAHAIDAYNLGRWSPSPGARAVVLRGAGPPRRFEVIDDRRLRMITDSTLDYTLSRERGAREFDYRVRLEGMLVAQDHGAAFTECLTRLRAAVGTGADYARLMRQYRSLRTRGRPLLAEIEGRFRWARDGSPETVVVDRLITLRPKDGC